MELTDDQKRIIAGRLADGAGIADIQRLIQHEFSKHITYMETRFLLDDLDLDLAAPPAPPAEPDGAAATADEADSDAIAQDAEAELVSGVTVDIDRIKQPGAALSGSVTFSDGAKAKWFVDTYGRLGLDPEREGYQPSPEDIQEFQLELQKQMQGPGI